MTAETISESLEAGFLPRTSPAPQGSGFAAGGLLDTCTPGASLAGMAEAATRDGRLAGLADDELIGVLRAWRRLESWSSAGTLAAAAELARRRPAGQTPPAGPGEFPAPLEELRARAYLDTLLGRDSTPRPVPADPAAPSPPARPSPSAPSSPPAPPSSSSSSVPSSPPSPGQRRLAAQINLTLPLATALGLADHYTVGPDADP